MELLVTLIASGGAIIGAITAVLGLINRKKISEVHILVNSRLDATLTEIEDLKQQRDIKHAQDVSNQEGN